ncbi:MAG: hypothetical protein NC080_07565 [Paraprevotella sp.]|nr:hypothetical protein [Paraprevotella sp.]
MSAKPKKKRNKKYVPKRVELIPLASRLCKTQRIMQPLDSLIEGMERYGTVDTIRNNVVVHDVAAQEWYELLPCARGFLDVFEIWARRHNYALKTTGIHQLISRLEYSAPVTPLELDAAKKELNEVRRIMQRADVASLLEAVRDAGIKIAIENAGC